MNRLHGKRTSPFQKAAWDTGSKKWHMCQEHLQTIELSRNEPLQWVSNFKVHQTCTGTEKKFETSNYGPCAGLVRSEVQNFCFFVPAQVWCALKFKTFVFFVPVQVWCALNFKTCAFCPVQVWCTLTLKPGVFLCLWRFGATHLVKHFYLICAFENLRNK